MSSGLSNNANNGLLTKIWGRHAWIFGHAVTFGYPLTPSEEQKNDYKEFFIKFGKVLPCKYCRESYQKFITSGNSELTDDVFKNRDSISRWFYNVHNAVNNKLQVDYGVTYEDVVKKYESCRAKCGHSKDIKTTGCVAPLDAKAQAFTKINTVDCPIISLESALKFEKYARMRNIDNDYFAFMKLTLGLNGDKTLMKQTNSWNYRNKYCWDKIQYMRENAIPSVETTGKYKNMPSIDELKLILHLCSNLNKEELINAEKAVSAIIE